MVVKLFRFIPIIAAIFILAACNLAPAATATPTVTQMLIVAWVEDGNLLIWRQGDTEPRRIASGGVVRPYLAPDGKHIVFTRGPQGNPETLWVVDVVGSAEQQIVGSKDVRPIRAGSGKLLMGQVGWFNESVLYFNTLVQTDADVIAQNDLYRANIRTREVALILPRTEGGQFSISPNHEFIAVIYPGTYGKQDGRISVIDPLASQSARNLLFFIGVSTGSNYGFYPTPYWEADSRALRVAIPDKDIVYADSGRTAKFVDLWRLPIAEPNTRQVVGSLNASFFGLPQWSFDGSGLTYVQRVGGADSNQFELYVAGSAGEDAVSYAAGRAGVLQPSQWIPGTTRFIYANGDPGTYWLGAAGEPPKRLPNDSEAIFAPICVAGGVCVFTTAPAASGVQLRSIRLDALGSPSELIAPVNVPAPVFDAVLAS